MRREPSDSPAQDQPRRSVRRAVVPAYTTALVVLLLGPALGPGYVFSYDMVFTPRQWFVPDAFGLGSRAPRAVPVDAVMAAVTAIVSGDVLQKAVLTATLFVAGFGAARLVPSSRTGTRCVAATAYVWNPFVVERLLLGHWSLLIGYAALPWILRCARSLRAGRGNPAALVAWCALAALTPTGGVLVAGTAMTVLVWPGTRLRRRRTALLAAALAAVNAPWWVPGLLGAAGAIGVGAAGAYASRADTPLGLPLSLLSLGGVWNGQVVPASRSGWLGIAATVFLLGVATLGLQPLARRWGRRDLVACAAPGLAGFSLAVASQLPLLGDTWLRLIAGSPALGIFRDAAKWIAPLAGLLAVCAALGAERLGTALQRRLGDPGAVPAVAVAACVLLVAVLPDATWGAAGRLDATRYPGDWDRVLRVLRDDPGGGDVAAVPWQAYRAFRWNGRRPLLDPAPRYFPRTVVTADDLLVGDVVIPGDDPRAERVGPLLAAGDLPALRREGIGWLLVERKTPGVVPADLVTGLSPVVRGADLELYRLGPARSPDLPPWAGWVILADIAAAVTALSAATVAIVIVVRRRRSVRLLVSEPEPR